MLYAAIGRLSLSAWSFNADRYETEHVNRQNNPQNSHPHTHTNLTSTSSHHPRSPIDCIVELVRPIISASHSLEDKRPGPQGSAFFVSVYVFTWRYKLIQKLNTTNQHVIDPAVRDHRGFVIAAIYVVFLFGVDCRYALVIYTQGLYWNTY